MSKGAGRIERAIRSLFDTHPDLAFTTENLIEQCFADSETVERKHQVSVLRAAHKIVAVGPNWKGWRIDQQGCGWAFLNQANVQSYALARLIASGGSYNHLDQDELLAKLADDRHRELMAPGGSWGLAVQAH